jgi:Na+/phosphate symporter
MVANSLFLTIAILLALGFWLLGELKFFIPYKTVLFHEYGTAILVYLATLFLNLFAAAFVLNRKFFLKDTGRKLSHLDKQLHVGQTEVRVPSLEEEVD